MRLPVPTPVAALGPGRGRLPHRRASRTSARRRSARPSPPRRARRRRSRATATRSRWCSAGSIPVDGDEYADLREALEKLRLNDSSFTYEPETSGALGFGFRCGFLGLLHMEIVRERLEREYDLSLVATAPNVEYRVELADGDVEVVDNPSAMPPPNEIDGDRGAVRQRHRPHARPSTSARSWSSRQQRRGEMQKMEYLSEERVELVYAMPLAEIVMDFFDQLKSRTRGYASLDYEPAGYRASKLVEGRRAAQQRARRRVLDDRAPRQGVRLRAPHDREAARADPAPAVRRADPGRDRRAHHRPRDGEGEAQGRHRQVLRRRHHAASASCSSARRRARSA